MKTTPEFTEAEIQDMMDFTQVLALTEAARRRNKKIVRSILTTLLITGLVGGALFVYEQTSVSESTATSGMESSAPSQPPASNVPAATVPPDTTRQTAIAERTEIPLKKPAQKLPAEEKKKLIVEKKTETPSTIQVDSAKSVPVFVPAVPIDGYPALYEYFAKELRYPEQAVKDSIQGVTLVTFVITTEGKPAQVGTDHALGEAFEKEAIRVIELMPVWKPAQLDGSPVRSKVSVPITFTVKTIKTPR